jgi:hypothetical protein
MNKQEIIHSMEKLLKAIELQKDIIKGTEGKVNKLEMDKTLSNIRALYELFTVLNYLNTYGPETVTEEIKTEVKALLENEVINKTEPTPIQIKQPEPQKISEQQVINPTPQIATPKPEPKPIEIKPAVEKSVPAFGIAAQPVTKTDSMEVKKTSAQAQNKTFNDLKSSNSELTLADKLRMQKVEDLSKVITMADKFLFMNELFEGENETYKTVIETLNTIQTKLQAETYLKEIKTLYKWADKNEKVVVKFTELALRRFV